MTETTDGTHLKGTPELIAPFGVTVSTPAPENADDAHWTATITVAPDTAVNARQVFPPIRSETYETGAKWDIGGATLTGALFRVTQPVQVTNSQNVFTQGGTERHEGL